MGRPLYNPVRGPLYDPLYGPTADKFGATPLYEFDFTAGTTLDSVSLIGSLTQATLTNGRTMRDSSGDLVWAEENFILQSNTLTTSPWGSATDITVTEDSSEAPAGSTTAWRVESGGASGTKFHRQTSFTIQQGAPFVMGIKGKKGNYRYLGIRCGNNSSVHLVFDFDTETFSGDTTTYTGAFSDIGDGWYFITCAIESLPQASAIFGIAMTDSAGNESNNATVAGDHFFVADAQSNRGDTINRYVATTTSTYFGHRFSAHYFDSTWQNGGFLGEGARTDRMPWNRDMSNAAWTTGLLTATHDATGIDGIANTATTLTATGNNGTVNQGVTLTSSERTTSLQIRRKTGTGVIQLTDDGFSTFTNIEGSINSSTYTKIDLTNTQSNPDIGVLVAISGDEVEVDFFGIEEGAFSSSEILTDSSAEARSADDISHTISQRPVTYYWEGRTARGGGSQVFGQIDDGTENERIRLERNASDEIHLIVTDGGVAQADLNLGTKADDTNLKVAAVVDTNNVKAIMDGGTEQTDVLATMPTVTTVRFCKDSAAGEEWYGFMAKHTAWAQEFTSTELSNLVS